MTIDVPTRPLHRQLLARAEDLTPLPMAVTALARLLGDPDTMPDDIAGVVLQDPALTAAVLREANSAWVATVDTIDTVERAFVLLGRARFLMLAVKDHVDEQFRVNLPQYGLAKGELWRHSVATSFAADTVRVAAGAEINGAALSAALLHDLAKLVLCDFIDIRLLGEEYRGITVTGLERELVGTDHSELGAEILESWGLPASICGVVAGHHDLAHAEHAVTAHAVAVADAIAHDLVGPHDDPGAGFFATSAVDVDGSLQALRIDPGHWDRLLTETRTRLQTVLT